MAEIVSYEARAAHDPLMGQGELVDTRSEAEREAEAHRFAAIQRKLSWLDSMFEREILIQADERAERATDDDFYDGDQFSEEDKRELEARGQSALVFNEIKSTIDWILGAEKRARVDWRILPRSEDDVEPAIRKTKLFKYVSDINKAPWQRSAAFADAVKSGLGWLEVAAENDDNGDIKLIYRRESWRNVWADASAVEPDLSDARYVFRTKLLDLDMAQALFPQHAEVLRAVSEERDALEEEDRQSIYHGAHGSSTFLRAGTILLGAQSLGSREAIRLVECWYRTPQVVHVLRGEGRLKGEVYAPDDPDQADAIERGQVQVVATTSMQVRVAFFCKGVLLFDAASPYRHGRFPFVPIVANRRGKNNSPYGVIRNQRDPQEDLNKRRNKALYLLSTRRVVMDKNAVDDLDALEEEMARPDSIIEKNAGKELQIIENGALAEQHVALAMQDSAYIRQASGVTGENLGLQTNATSGKAIGMRSEQGTIVTATLFDNLRLANQLGGELLLSNIEQFMTEQMQFRITGERGRPDFVTVNDGLPENDIARAAADYIVDEEDYRATIRAALAEQLLMLAGQLAQRTGNPAIAIAFVDMAVELTDIPNREEIVARVRKLANLPNPDEKPEEREAREQAEAQAAAKQQALQEREVMARIAREEAQAEEAKAKAVREKLEALREGIENAARTASVPELAGMVDDLLGSLDSILTPRQPAAGPAMADPAQQPVEQPSGAPSLPDQSGM